LTIDVKTDDSKLVNKKFYEFIDKASPKVRFLMNLGYNISLYRLDSSLKMYELER